MTLGKLILETARGDVKKRSVTPQELREIWEAIAAWQPIETAPKDGSHILAVDAGDTNGFGTYDGVRVPTQTVVHWWSHLGEEGWYTSVNELAPLRPFSATHWVPLAGFPQRRSGESS